MDYYALNEDEVEKLVDEATKRDSEAVDFYRFTSAITQLPEEERIEIIRMMWQVVFADEQEPRARGQHGLAHRRTDRRVGPPAHDLAQPDGARHRLSYSSSNASNAP